ERVIFVGGIDHKETPPFFRSADLTVLPSSPPESFGLVLIESLACGTPVVASDIPGVRTVVGHGVDGLLVEPNKPTALARALQGILEDTPRFTVMRRLGREKVVARYDWGQIGTRLETIYRQVIDDSGAHLSAHARGER